MAEEPVHAPDQLKPLNRTWARIAGIVAIVSLLAMTQPFNNHASLIEDFFLVLIAGIVAVLMIGDAVLHRNGLRR